MVLNKPAGLPVHSGPGGKPSLEAWLPGLQMGKRHLPQPAHRLDTDTAGCLVLGRTKPALAALGALFAAGAVAKTYWAVTRGGPAGESGEVSLPLLKHSTKAAGWRMIPDPAGQSAVTGWRVLGRGDGLCWLEFTPRTGRTHQLRVHAAAALGGAILGDPVYGKAGGGLHLLARRIGFDWPDGDSPGGRIEVEAPVPEHMRAAIAACSTRAPPP
ncbi:tRNA pseudouridine32 synthase / 23S rRNA pseudouridine746 synthase/23S rRNA pseudouridine1911/1915/1917 synthase [Humitalea rosea]|uniref:tRNA pseudouridine32 synthase / 23S rRNA pseudouridine746 synthase/23S rRNA pseudouridine1911/1915/1917 synthase n=2 Tax=Humitalea rosea TaxID=990373 RepID=A0A2W7IIG3_9PROT|nr:tRNA pseudouridine32 synthase / 23S rRNA pseudouridine746 synthase/23S rRNA pseudouridine1911/1915/1917 synthase [Humitalea rosea]